MAFEIIKLTYLLTYCRCTMDANFVVGLYNVYRYSNHRRSQEVLWGCTFCSKKLTTYLVAALKQAKITQLTAPTLQISPLTKMCSKIGLLALPEGALTCLGCNYNFPYKLRPQDNFYSPPSGCTCT